MDILSKLIEKNPELPFHSIYDPAFRPYGRTLPFDPAGLIDACKLLAPMPPSGSRYVPSIEQLEAMSSIEAFMVDFGGEMDLQAGCCWGYNSLLNCLEYHRSSEWNIAVTDMVLLMARQQDMEGLDLPEGKIEAFLCPKGTAIEVYATTLHFCPCQVKRNGFYSIVLLPRDTNQPLERPKPAGTDGRLLWAKNKWLIAHPQNLPVINRGAYPGLNGENYNIKY